jgi:hypothetical protein
VACVALLSCANHLEYKGIRLCRYPSSVLESNIRSSLGRVPVTSTYDTPTPTAASVWDVVLGVQAKLRWLAGVDLGCLSDEDIDALIPEVEEAARTMPVAQQSLVAQVMDRGVHEAHGCTSPMAYLQARLRLRRSEANARVGAAERFQPRTAMTGERLAPMFPAVAEALRDGAISMDHASVIATSVEHLPAAVSDADKAHAEQVLVERARESDPCLLGRYASRIEAHLDPDGVLATEEEQREAQELFLRKDLHGMWRLSGRFDAENAATIQAALSLLAKPKKQPDDSRDPRPAARRRAEALVTILGWSLDHDNQPTSGGNHPHIGVSVTLAELDARTPGRLTTGDLISGETLERMLCDAVTSLTVFSTVGAILYHGRDLRVATEAQRKALIARDKGCTHPGCDAPPWFCDVHHVIAWKDGGFTDVDEMTLRCRRHHILAHKGDWRIIMIHGIPHTIAPAWLDPSQTPRRNTAHDPP